MNLAALKGLAATHNITVASNASVATIVAALNKAGVNEDGTIDVAPVLNKTVKAVFTKTTDNVEVIVTTSGSTINGKKVDVLGASGNPVTIDGTESVGDFFITSSDNQDERTWNIHCIKAGVKALVAEGQRAIVAITHSTYTNMKGVSNLLVIASKKENQALGVSLLGGAVKQVSGISYHYIRLITDNPLEREAQCLPASTVVKVFVNDTIDFYDRPSDTTQANILSVLAHKADTRSYAGLVPYGTELSAGWVKVAYISDVLNLAAFLADSNESVSPDVAEMFIKRMANAVRKNHKQSARRTLALCLNYFNKLLGVTAEVDAELDLFANTPVVSTPTNGFID